MAIATDDGVWKFGTQDEVTSGTPATIASDAFGKADQGASVNWTNTDNAPFAAAALKLQFDTTMPTVGSVGLYARVLNIQGVNDPGVPDANNNSLGFVGSFPIDFGVANDTDFYTFIDNLALPAHAASQAMDFYLFNNATGQTIGVSWQLWITPKALGPAA